MKTCSACNNEKELDQFHNRTNAKDGKHGQCKQCIANKYKKRYKLNKEKISNKNKAYREANRESWLEGKRKYYKDNRESILTKHKRYREENQRSIKEQIHAWRDNNIEHLRTYNRARRSKMRKATPKWLNEEQKREIYTTYAQARDCEIISGQQYHVDHIVPLVNKIVCGLHVPWNLQILPQDINDSKGNKFDGGW